MNTLAPGQIPKIAHPKLPQFIFEWHPEKQKVYLITVPGKWVDGHFVKDLTVLTVNAEVIAEHCEHHAMFYGFVQTWLRGYNKGKGE